MADTFLVGIDGSEPSERAARHALLRAKSSGASLHVVYVYEWSRYSLLTMEDIEVRHKEHLEEIDRARTEILDPLVESLRAEGGGVEVQAEVRHGHAAEVLCLMAGELKATQIYIGRRGQSKFANLIFGSVASNLVQVAPVPVTVVP